MNYQKLKILELKSICKKNKIKGYSKCNKEQLIVLLKENLKKMKGGNNNNTQNEKVILNKNFVNQLSKNKSICKDSIYISRAGIEEINDNAFRSIDCYAKIKSINLSYNKITKIQDNLFKQFINLKEIYLNNNLIEEIGNNVFNEDLEEINLSNNKLKYINPEVFRNMRKLKKLNLSNNYLTKENIGEITKKINGERLLFNEKCIIYS
jgi:Leucine-rich repeat (LRR) protein